MHLAHLSVSPSVYPSIVCPKDVNIDFFVNGDMES